MTNKQKQDNFDKYLSNENYNMTHLPTAIEWIRKNLSPDEVFNKTELLHWCKENEDHLENKYPIQE